MIWGWLQFSEQLGRGCCAGVPCPALQLLSRCSQILLGVKAPQGTSRLLAPLRNFTSPQLFTSWTFCFPALSLGIAVIQLRHWFAFNHKGNLNSICPAYHLHSAPPCKNLPKGSLLMSPLESHGESEQINCPPTDKDKSHHLLKLSLSNPVLFFHYLLLEI